MVNECPKDLPPCTNPARVFQDGHATNTPTGGLRNMVARLRHDGTDADRLPVQEASDMQGARFGIAWSAKAKRIMGSQDTMAQFVGFCSANGTSLYG